MAVLPDATNHKFTFSLRHIHTHTHTDVPVISLSLGAPLDSQNLMEGSDVYLECDIKANPPAKKIEWFHNVSIKLGPLGKGVVNGD